jgi:hypothetical protein
MGRGDKEITSTAPTPNSRFPLPNLPPLPIPHFPLPILPPFHIPYAPRLTPDANRFILSLRS